MNIRTREELIDFLNGGNKVTYLFFWGHRKPKSGVSKSCLSQWYDSPFAVDGITYQTAEHFMMADKARLFGDSDTVNKIVMADNPRKAKSLGRKVQGFDERVWVNHRCEIVVKANIKKFDQNPKLREFLLNTGNRVLVEASPFDKIWGIGLAADSPDIENPNIWKGLNLLGFALMEVRDQLTAKGA